jgi:hypothetical protein
LGEARAFENRAGAPALSDQPVTHRDVVTFKTCR